LRLLLDTHIFLWSLLEPERLVPQVAAALQDPANELWLSPVSTWEALLLAERGRVSLEPTPIDWVRSALRKTPLREAPLVHEAAIQSRLVRLPHGDPVDRFLAATAVIYELTLVTADERLIAAGAVPVLPNR
jgi:PIN domain nuclease of toxin-antitoxin system